MIKKKIPSQESNDAEDRSRKDVRKRSQLIVIDDDLYDDKEFREFFKTTK